MTNQRQNDILEALNSGLVRKNTWGWAVGMYLLENPEQGEEMANHHYQSFLQKKLEMIIPDIRAGRHLNRIAVHNYLKNAICVYPASMSRELEAGVALMNNI